ncbi:hypothetical protein SBA6_290011 [Candidatus Sulfopaludibacter sp. SbA6]|nr:hypothetical protein SBA6_290011 [Candidatus Sulfopaludibacter sp. SbA6]
MTQDALPAIPSSWIWAEVGDLLSGIEAGYSFKCEERPPENAEVGVVKVSAVTWGEFDEDASKTCLSSDRVDPKLFIRPGDFLFSRANTIQLVGACVIVHRISRRLMLSDKILRLRFHTVVPQWLLYVLRTSWGRAEIERLATGNQESMRNIGQDRIRAIRIPVPPLAEQRRIVEDIEKQFTRLEAAVAALQRAKANLKACRTSATEAAFASHSAAPIRHLGDLGEIVGGLTKGQRRKAGTRTRPVPYLRVANVQRGRLDLETIKLIEATEEEIRTLQLIPGDVLLNEGGDRDKLGRGWIWEGQISECIHQNHVFRVRLDPGLATPRFVSHYANHFGQKYFFKEGRQTTNLASINMTNLRALPIPLPPVSDQEKVIADLEDHLSMIDNLDHSVDANLRRATALRQVILNKAFEGKLLPQDPNDEPASLLLERIQAAHAKAPARRAARKREVHA